LDAAATPSATGAAAEASRGRRSHFRAAVFGGMLVLAMAAMALAMSKAVRTSGVWGGLLVVYAGVSIAWDWQRTRERSEPIARTLRLQLLHWGAVFVGLLVLLLFEHSGILGRDAASGVALLLLAVVWIYLRLRSHRAASR